MDCHQFRTPLTAIYSNSELLELKICNLEKNGKHDFTIITDRIKNEVNIVTELIDNILV